MNTNHKHHIHLLIVTYVLLAAASPLVWGGADEAHAQAVNCPPGYTCTPIQPVSNCPTGFVCTPTSAFGGGGGFSTTNTAANLPTTATQNTACYSFSSDLTVGNNGDTVRALQAFLVSRGYRTLPTGYFGSLTAAALAQYQAAHGISEDGYFGPATRAQVNADCGNSSSYTAPTTTSTAQTQTTKPIYWSGGRGKVQIGLVDNRFFGSNPVILGWITLNGGESGVANWSISFITDLTGTVNWQASNLSQGPFRIIAVTAGPTGNYCTTSSSDCVYTLSAPFNLSDTSALTLVLPPSARTTYTGNSSPLSVSCYGSAYDKASLGISWGSQISGGVAPFQYAWSMYGDVSGYPGGSTQSQAVNVNYSSSGMKQAVLRVTDAAGTSVNQTCSVTIPVQSATPIVSQATLKYDMAISYPYTGNVVVTGSDSFLRWTYPNDLAGKFVIIQARIMTQSQLASAGTISPSNLPGTLFDNENVSVTVVDANHTLQAVVALKNAVAHLPAGQYAILITATDPATNIIHAGLSGIFNVSSGVTAPVTSPLSYACTGMVLNSTDISWSVQASGGTAPYTYAWSAYNDLASYIGGSTVSAAFSAKYSSSGTKQAVARITDANGSTVNATCSVTLTAAAPAPAPTPAPASPSSTLLISLRSIHLGDLVTLLSNTTSPTASLRSAAIDMSTDNASWQSGAPCGYWNSPTGTDSAHAITCNFTPTAAGTYYFRTRGTDSVGASSFSYQTLTVLP